MKLSQAVIFISTFLATSSDAMTIRGIVNKSTVVDKDDLAKSTTLLNKDAAAINNDDEEQHGLLQVEEGGRLLAKTITTEMDALRKLDGYEDMTIYLGACEDFAVMAGSTATCAGSYDCYIIGGDVAVSPGTSITGNFVGDVAPAVASAVCAKDGLAAWKLGRAMIGTPMLAEMGGKKFGPGIHTHGSAINIALTNPVVYLDAQGDPDAQFIFNIGSTLTTSAGSKIELMNGAKAENVFWVLGTALTMGADSILVGSVLAGTAITMGTNAKIMGRAIAQTAVTCETACAVETSGRRSDFPSSVPTGPPTKAPKKGPVPERHYTAGKESGGFDYYPSSNVETHKVRCCSESSCTSLFKDESGGKFRLVSYYLAYDICDKEKSSLCTRNELYFCTLDDSSSSDQKSFTWSSDAVKPLP